MHRLVRLLVIIAGMSVAGIRVPFAAAAAPGPSANGAAQASNLRELYEQGPSRSRGDVKVGRLMVQLIQQGTPRRVGIGRVFSSGDTFRFEVSSNRSGWLYVLHRSPGGQPQLLWPRPDNDRPDAYLDANEVEAYQSYLIPPPPGVFEFDAEVGKEQFYVVIRSQPRTPELSAVWPGPGAVSPDPEPSPVQLDAAVLTEDRSVQRARWLRQRRRADARRGVRSRWRGRRSERVFRVGGRRRQR